MSDDLSNDTTLKKHDISTMIELLAPRRMGITLVPLSDVEEAESAQFWTTVFLSVSTAIGGNLLSLELTAFPNRPVVMLLRGFGTGFLILFAAFAYKHWALKKRARHRAIGPSSASVKTPSGREKQLEVIALVYHLMTAIRRQVFQGRGTMPVEQVEDNVKDFISEETSPEFRKQVVKDWQRLRIIRIFDDEQGRSIAAINESLWPEQLYPGVDLMETIRRQEV